MTREDEFSPTEKKIIDLLLQGKSNKQIALALGISERTVEFHLTNIYRKLGVRSRAEAFTKLREPAGDLLRGNTGESTVETGGGNGYRGGKEEFSEPLQRYPFGLYLALFALVISIYFLQKPFRYEREAELSDAFTVGQVMDRSEASGGKVHGQFGTVAAWPAQPGSVTYNEITLLETADLYLKLRYSKNSPTSVPILVFLDGETIPRQSLFPKDQGDWNRFAWTEAIDLGRVDRGVHSLTFFTEGQVYGVADLDKFILTTGPP